jgi:hypothetical protein
MRYLELAIGLCCIFTLVTSSLITDINEANYSFAPGAGSDIPAPIYSETINIIK